MGEVATVFAIVAVVVALFVWNRLPVDVIVIGAALSLWATGILDFKEVLSGFGDPTVLFIASLFVVSEGLDATGVTTWAGQQLIDRAGTGRARLIVLTMLLSAFMTALISVNGAVAALMPVVVVMAVRLDRAPSELLLPLVFGAHAGSMLALTGTPVSVLINDAIGGAGARPFGFFEFAGAGIPLLAGAILIVVLFGERLIPRRTARSIPRNLSAHARTLVEQYRLDADAHYLRVREGSPLSGRSRSALGAHPDAGVNLIGIKAPEGLAAAPDRPVSPGDLLIVQGEAAAIGGFATENSLAIRSDDTGIDIASKLVSRESGLAEVVVPPRSALVGTTMFPGMVTESGDLVVLAVHRKGEDLGFREVELAVGDTLLLQGTWDALDENLGDPEVLVVNSPNVVRRQAVPLGPGAKRAIGILAAMVLLLVVNVIPPAAVGLLAAGAMILTRVLTVEESYRAINWTTIVMVAAMMPLSVALTQTGAATLIAEKLVSFAGAMGPYALLAGLFLFTAILGQMISNMATALIVIPIAIAAAGDMGLSVVPVLMSVNVAATAAYLTPVATPVNMMIMGPAGYRFGDYWRLGLPLMVLTFVIAVFWVPVVWPL